MATWAARQTLRRNLWLALVPVVAGLAAYHDIQLQFLGKAVAVGFAGGLAGGLLAGAIGLVSVPLIVLVLGLPIHAAVATNLFQTLFTAASGAAAHARRGAVQLRLAGTLLAGAVVGAPLGAWVSIGLPEARLRAAFTIILLAMALNLLRRLTRPAPQRAAWLRALDRIDGPSWMQPIEGTFQGHTYRVSPPVAVGLGAAIGFVSGLLGIGGGFLVTPLVATFLHVPTRLALGSGLVVIAGNSALGTLPHFLVGNVLITTGLALAIGGAIGAQVGTRLSHRVPERAMFVAFAVVLLVVAWRMAPW